MYILTNQWDHRKLKIFAIITMIMDHIGAIIIEPIILYQMNLGESSNTLVTFYYGLRMIGRLAFPIFCFLLVEGFLHTHNIKKYLGQLLLFATISEIPFDLAFYGVPFDSTSQNVFFTLFLGLLVLCGLKHYEKSKIVQLFMVLLGCCMAYFMNTDYSYIGILIITIFYIFHNQTIWRNMTIGGILVLETLHVFGVGVLSLIPIHLYNHEKGAVKYKFFYYAFYPIHLLLFYVLQMGLLYIL